MTSLSSLPKGVYLEKALPLLAADVPAKHMLRGDPELLISPFSSHIC